MKGKVIGSIFMILGTCIGAGMLALPLVSAHENILYICLMMFFAWAIMTIGAFAILEVNLWLPEESNLISMAKTTLGPIGQLLAWLTTLLLLYSLLAAYIAGTSDVLHRLLSYIHVNVPHWVSSLIAVLALSYIVIRGIRSVDIMTRGLMSVKLFAFAALVIAVMPTLHMNFLNQGDSNFHFSAFMVMVTSFGYATIIPSIRTYLNSNRKQLHWVIVLGSLIPLIIYLIWIATVQGLIPRLGMQGLIATAAGDHATGHLMAAVTSHTSSRWLKSLADLFISICAVTSFLGVSLCLTDFIADGIKRKKEGSDKVLIYFLTFLPPLIVVLMMPKIFITALSYAGILCVLLLVLLPTMMVFSGRHIKDLSAKEYGIKSKIFLISIMFVSLAMIITLTLQKL